MEGNFKSLNKGIDNYFSDIQNPSYQIVIVGAIKAGKSTLINALIEHELASVNVTPETETLTKFKNSKINSLKVKFYSFNEWNEIWKEVNEAEIFLNEYKNLEAEGIKNEFLDKKDIK